MMRRFNMVWKKNKRKVVKNGINVPNTFTEENIRFLIRDLEAGNTASTKNFLRSCLNKKKNPLEPILPLKEVAESYAEKNRNKATLSEIEFKKILDDLKINHIFQQPFSPDGKKFFIMDFYIPDKKVCFEIDGEYHNTEEQLKKDRYRTKLIEKFKIKVVRLTNEEVFMKNHCRKVIMDNL